MPNSSPLELFALQDLLSQLCPHLALALAEQINVEPSLEMEQVEDVPLGDLLGRAESVLATVFSLSGPNMSESILSLPEDAARLFVSLMEGQDGTMPPELLTDAQTDKLAEAMSALARGFATALGSQSNTLIEVETCSTHMGAITLPPVFALEENGVQARITLTVPGLYEGPISFYFTPALAKALIGDKLPDGANPADSPANEETLSEDELTRMLSDIGGLGGQPVSALSMPESPTGASPFPSLSTFESTLPRGMELIMDIPLDVTVELGRVRMLIKDVLELASGSIVELDRVAGEPVDLLVNGRLIAKGEVVVIEDNFGIRITEVLSPADRVASLGKGR